MKIIQNIKDLDKVFEPYLEKAMLLTRDEIFEVVSRKVSDYYNEPVFSDPDPTEPNYYSRTGQLMESLTATHITKSGNAMEFRVGWDDDYLTFRYPRGFTTKKYGDKYNGITGLQVLQAFNSGTHGYTVDGEHNYWDEALAELGGEQGIINRFKANCKKVGLPIT